jgi:hypothetical protein
LVAWRSSLAVVGTQNPVGERAFESVFSRFQGWRQVVGGERGWFLFAVVQIKIFEFLRLEPGAGGE